MWETNLAVFIASILAGSLLYHWMQLRSVRRENLQYLEMLDSITMILYRLSDESKKLRLKMHAIKRLAKGDDVNGLLSGLQKDYNVTVVENDTHYNAYDTETWQLICRHPRTKGAAVDVAADVLAWLYDNARDRLSEWDIKRLERRQK